MNAEEVEGKMQDVLEDEIDEVVRHKVSFMQF